MLAVEADAVTLRKLEMAVQRSAERGPLGCVLVALALLAAGGCEPRVRAQPAIEFSTVPPAAAGGGATRSAISGRARGARPGQQIVLFAKGGVWWVQPLTAQPFTRIAADGSWTSTIHLGTEYAALLVEPG